jgi:methanol metabolism-related c-type cytochrome
VKSCLSTAAFVLAATLLCTGVVLSDGLGDPAAVKEEDGKYFDKDSNPTYSLKPDGTVDWYTFSGFRRYHSDCHVCHGPDGMGSSYAPALKDTLNTSTYNDFMGVVAGGKKVVSSAQNLVMPSFGLNKNVMCYADDIFVYLRARANDAIGRGRPAKHEEKPVAATRWEDSCMGTGH